VKELAATESMEPAGSGATWTGKPERVLFTGVKASTATALHGESSTGENGARGKRCDMDLSRASGEDRESRINERGCRLNVEVIES
jgi:hypothetical protein